MIRDIIGNIKSSCITVLLVAFMIVFALFNMGNFETSDILLGAIFILIVWMSQVLTGKKPSGNQVDGRIQKVSIVCAVIWTLSYAIYAGERLKNGLENKAFALAFIVLTVAGVYLIFYKAILVVIVALIDKDKSTQGERVDFGQIKKGRFEIKTFLIYTLILFACMLPLFLLNYPGTMTVDSFNQLNQARYLAPYSDHHPWVHTMIIKFFFEIGYRFGGDTYLGIAVYVLAQMLALAMSVAYAITSLAEAGLSKRGQIAVLLGFVIYPYNLAYAITIWKDILFAAAVLVLTVTIYRLEVMRVKLGVRDSLLLVCSSLGMCLIRHNGLYAYIITMLVILAVELVRLVKGKSTQNTQEDATDGKKEHKGLVKLAILLIVFVLSISATAIIRGPLQRAYDVEPGDSAHNYAIPLQQIARVVAYNGAISDDDLALIEQINTKEYIYNNYVPGGADNMIQWLVEGDVPYFEEHKAEYLGLWFRLGLKNPSAYMQAYFDQTKGYYTTMMPEQIAYYGILDNSDGLATQPVLGATVRIKIDEICSKLQNIIPIYGILYSMGACIMLLILGIGLQIVRKDGALVLVYLPQLALNLTLMIATPLVADLRYAYPLVLAMPTLIAMTIGGRQMMNRE